MLGRTRCIPRHTLHEQGAQHGADDGADGCKHQYEHLADAGRTRRREDDERY